MTTVTINPTASDLVLQRLFEDLAARTLLGVAVAAPAADAVATTDSEPQAQILPTPCPCCGARMRISETLARGCEPKHRPVSAMVRIDTS